MDFWTVVRRRLLGVPALDYALVGRWVAWLARGRFRHDPIAASPPVPGERLLGWAVHYLTGVAFAGVLLAIWGIEWTRHPTLAPALIVGVASVAALPRDAARNGRGACRQPHAASLDRPHP